jgi:AraC-like DNA-binding protein
MNGHSLTLRVLQVESGEAWNVPGGGLCFLLPKNGEGICVCGADKVPIVQGDVVIVGNGSGATLSVPKGKTFQLGWFSLSLEHLYPLFGSSEIIHLHSFAEGFQGLLRYQGGTIEARECHRALGEVPAEFNLDHRSRLLRVVATALSAPLDRVQQQKTGLLPQDAHFSKVVAALSIDDLQRMGIHELATRFGCSRRHLNRLFHKHFGISVAELRREARLLKALCLLRHPGSKIMNVAEECGFNHLGLFNSRFKSRFGTSPGQLRKEWALAEAGLNAPTTSPSKPEIAPNRVPIAKLTPSDAGSPVAITQKPRSAARKGNGGSGPERLAAREWLELKRQEVMSAVKARVQAGQLRPSHS